MRRAQREEKQCILQLRYQFRRSDSNFYGSEPSRGSSPCSTEAVNSVRVSRRDGVNEGWLCYSFIISSITLSSKKTQATPISIEKQINFPTTGVRALNDSYPRPAKRKMQKEGKPTVSASAPKKADSRHRLGPSEKKGKESILQQSQSLGF